jgi:hypothetical protein
MSKVSHLLVGLGVVALLAGPALAQPPQGQGRGGRGGPGGFGGGPGMGGVSMLLNNESVQKELKLDKDEIEKAKAVAKKVGEAHHEDFTKLQDLDPQERMAKRREVSTAINAEILKDLDGVLKPDQVKRLKQIELQQQHAMAFMSPDVQKSLNLSADQVEKVKTINDDARTEMQALFQAGGGGRRGGAGAGGGMEKFQGLQKETMTKIEGVLNDAQKKTWKEMTGEPFKLEMQFGGPGGRRGGRGGNNGGGGSGQ